MYKCDKLAGRPQLRSLIVRYSRGTLRRLLYLSTSGTPWSSFLPGRLLRFG